MKFLVLLLLSLFLFIEIKGLPDSIKTRSNYKKVESILGKGLALRYFGTFEDEIQLPPIPEMKADATSIDVYSKKEKSIKIDPKIKQKFDYIFVNELMQAVQQRKINQNEIANWMNVLNQGGSREGVYRAMILGDDYGELENFDKTTSEASATFAVEFLETYLEQTVNKDTLMQMNFYSVKRLVCEKSLEVLDAFSSIDDQARWFGVLSKNLATNYGEVFLSEIRKTKNAKAHYSWVKTVPTQHLKSETLIKLHQVFNHLQGHY